MNCHTKYSFRLSMNSRRNGTSAFSPSSTASFTDVSLPTFTSTMSVNRRARLLSMLHVMDVSRQPQKPSNLGGADPDLIASNQTVLSHAAKAGHAEICEFLLSRYNVKVDSRNIRNNFTPLLIAASFGHAPVVRVLLAHGANPNETEGGRDRSGRSALSLACVRGFSAVVDVLLADAPGLKVDGYSTNTDHIPLLVAIIFRHESIAL